MIRHRHYDNSINTTWVMVKIVFTLIRAAILAVILDFAESFRVVAPHSLDSWSRTSYLTKNAIKCFPKIWGVKGQNPICPRDWVDFSLSLPFSYLSIQLNHRPIHQSAKIFVLIESHLFFYSPLHKQEYHNEPWQTYTPMHAHKHTHVSSFAHAFTQTHTYIAKPQYTKDSPHHDRNHCVYM